MRSDFRETNLGEICEVITDGAHLSPKSVDQGLPMASVKDLFDWGINTKTARHISEEDFNQLVRQGCQPKNDDVLIAKDGNSALDTVCIQRGAADYVLLSSVAILRPNKEVVIPNYLRFYLSAKNVIGHYKEFLISGAAIPRVVLKAFRTAPILLPDLTEQKRILAIVQPIQERIDTIRTENQVLESIAQTLFKSWFVNFDPVHAKAAGREPEGLSAEIAALFPSEFEESELGLIPKGWSVLPASSVCSLSIGKTPPRKESQWFSQRNSDIKWLSIKDMGTSGLVICDTSEYLTNDAVKKFNVKLAPPKTPFFSFKLTVGRVGISDESMCTNEAIAHFVCDKDVATYPFVMCQLFEQGKKAVDSTSSIGLATNSKLLKELPFLVPDKNLMEAFSALATPIFESIMNNARIIQTISDIRDELLPRLISGKIRIEEAEEALAEVMPSTEKQVA